jgi:hypothetical protein
LRTSAALGDSDTGITVKLYPSCAGTHPSLDAAPDLRTRERFRDATLSG